MNSNVPPDIVMNQGLVPLTVSRVVARKLLGIQDTKLKELIREGDLRAVQIGRSTMIDYATLLALVRGK